MVLRKIISGGQTGADQGALDAAISRSFSYGGSIPAGRKTEDGPLAEKYEMNVLFSEYYPDRTIKNVEDADGTLVLSRGVLSGGSLLTISAAEARNKPFLHIDFDSINLENGALTVTSWLREQRIEILNVAGPRLSSDPEIYDLARSLVIMIVEDVGFCHG